MHETTFLKSHQSSKLTAEFQEVEKFEGNFAQSCKVSDRSEDPWRSLEIFKKGHLTCKHLHTKFSHKKPASYYYKNQIETNQIPAW